MKARDIFLVFAKELTDSLRDRRTLISMIAVPVLLMPLLVLGMGFLTVSVVSKARQEIPKVMLVGGEHSPEIMGALRALDTVEVLPTSGDYTNLIAQKTIRAAVLVPDDFDAAVQGLEEATLRILEYEGDMKSGFASQTLEKFLRERRDRTVRDRLASRGLPDGIVRPFAVERTNVAPPRQVAGNLLGGLLPYMVILLCMTGGMYPAMDLTAGEKERGTMETILCSPVNRVDLVLGKFLMVMTASLTTAVLAIGSMAATFLVARAAAGDVLPSKSSGMALAVDPGSVLMVLAMIVPVAVLMSAAQLALSLFARSFKEAQTYLTPLMFAVIIPAVAAMTPGIELGPKLAWIPILNTSLVCKDIMAGQWHWAYIAWIFFSTWALAGAALYSAVRLFHRESVILRT